MTEHAPSRRKFPRLPSTNAVLVQLLGDAVNEDLARTCNISPGGCMFTSPKSFRIGAAIQILIKLGDDVIEAVARVVYVLPRQPTGYDVGVEFVFVGEEHRQTISALLEG